MWDEVLDVDRRHAAQGRVREVERRAGGGVEHRVQRHRDVVDVGDQPGPVDRVEPARLGRDVGGRVVQPEEGVEVLATLLGDHLAVPLLVEAVDHHPVEAEQRRAPRRPAAPPGPPPTAPAPAAPSRPGWTGRSTGSARPCSPARSRRPDGRRSGAGATSTSRAAQRRGLGTRRSIAVGTVRRPTSSASVRPIASSAVTPSRLADVGRDHDRRGRARRAPAVRRAAGSRPGCGSAPGRRS